MKNETRTYYAIYYHEVIANLHYTRGGINRQVKAVFQTRPEAEEYLEYINDKGGYRIVEVNVKGEA